MWIPFGKWIGEISYYLTLFKYELKSKHDMVSLLKAKAHNLGSPKTLIPGIFLKVYAVFLVASMIVWVFTL